MEQNKDYKEYFKGIAKQLHIVYQQCYPPIRELKEFRYYSKEAAQISNCLEHAVFNFSDEMLGWLFEKFGEDMSKFWSNFSGMGSPFEKKPQQQLSDTTPQNIERIRETGLKVEECSLDDELEDGQWKVAYYFNLCDEKGQFIPDFHFFRQEADGRWSSKLGRSMQICFYDELPQIFEGGYKLQKIFMITNPYIHKEKDIEND